MADFKHPITRGLVACRERVKKLREDLSCAQQNLRTIESNYDEMQRCFAGYEAALERLVKDEPLFGVDDYDYGKYMVRCAICGIESDDERPYSEERPFPHRKDCAWKQGKALAARKESA